MVGVFLLTTVFVIFIYIYLHRRAKNNRSADSNFVRDYHASFDRVRSHKELRDKQNNYRTYITKYNSSEDYRERNGK